MHNIGLSSNCIALLLHQTVSLFAFYLLFVYSSKQTVRTITTVSTIPCSVLWAYSIEMLLTFVPFIPTRSMQSISDYSLFLLFSCVFCILYVLQCAVCSQFLNHKPVFCYRIDHISMLYLTIGTMLSYFMRMRYIIEIGMFKANTWIWYELVLEGKMMNKLIASCLLHPLLSA